jgi:cytochrome c553
MRRHFRFSLAAAMVVASVPAVSQQPAPASPPPPPAFAAPNLSANGVRDMAANCASCHGTRGKSAPDSAVAALAGRPRDEMVQAMAQFKDGKRPATLMHQIAKGYSDAEIAAIADYFSKQPR